MKVPLIWLKDYVDLPDSVKELTDKLTSIGHMLDKPVEGVGDTAVADLEVRQNRADCLSILGVAREVAAVYDSKLKWSINNVIPSEVEGSSKHELLSVDIQNPEKCCRFAATRIDNVKIGESPEWLKKRLELYGVKTINNIVDITNFVMIELGEPMHAFDTALLPTPKIIIRNAEKGEKATFLNGKTYELTEEDLVVADEQSVISLAGMIGCDDSGMSAKTTSIILECATYNQATIRRSSLRHSIRTESSMRHEKFLDPRLAEVAMQRAVGLVLELAGGTISATFDAYPEVKNKAHVTLRASRIATLGGVEIDDGSIKNILSRLELPYIMTRGGEFAVEIPYFRTDLEQEADLVEEVLRIYGYENIPSRPIMSAPPKNITPVSLVIEDTIRDLLVAAGYDEQITDPLTNEASPTLPPVRLENSLNSEKMMLRTTLSENLEQVVVNQKKHGKETVTVFEIGKIYYKQGGDYLEKRTLGIAHAGKSQNDYFALKGVFELIASRLQKTPETDWYTITSTASGYYGQADLELLRDAPEARSKNNLRTKPPHVMKYDISFFARNDTPVGDMIKKIKEKTFVGNVSYSIDIVNEKRAVLLNITFASETPLESGIVAPIKDEIAHMIETEFGAEIRK